MLKTEGQKKKQKNSPKMYKKEIKIPANPGLASSRLNNPAQERRKRYQLRGGLVTGLYPTQGEGKILTISITPCDSN